MKKIVFSILSLYASIFFFLISWTAYAINNLTIYYSISFQHWFTNTPKIIIFLISTPIIISVLFIVSYFREKNKQVD